MYFGIRSNTFVLVCTCLFVLQKRNWEGRYGVEKMNIFDNIEQMLNHLDSEVQLEQVRRLLQKRKLEIGLIEREKNDNWL